MDCLFATRQPPLSDVIGESSVTAAVIVLLVASAIRFGPAPLKEKLTFLALYIPLIGVMESLIFVGPSPLHEKAAAIIYLVATFGFAIHNFHVAKRAYFINGMVWGFVTGLLITLLGSHDAFLSGDPVLHNNFAFRTAHVVFVLGWGLVCVSIFLKQRKTYSVIVADSAESSTP